jgi:aminoglycoside phosphotransferase (APT) family kinase protein
VVSLVRRLHDLTAGTPLAKGGEVVCHGDIAARNIVFRERSAACLLDWDLAAAGGDDRYQTMVYSWGGQPEHAAAVLAWLVDHARDLQQALNT